MLDIKPMINLANVKHKVRFTTKPNLKAIKSKNNIKVNNDNKANPIKITKKINKNAFN